MADKPPVDPLGDDPVNQERSSAGEAPLPPVPEPPPTGSYTQAASDGVEAGAAQAAVGTKPDVGKRVIAFIIDLVVAMILGIIPFIGSLLGAVYMLVRDGLDIDFMKRRSLGKKLMGLRPVRLDGQPMDIMTSIMRNWPLALGSLASSITYAPFLGLLGLSLLISLVGFVLLLVEIYYVLTSADGRRWGDRLAQTKVVESAN